MGLGDMAEESQFGIFISGDDGGGMWDPIFYGPYSSYEAAEQASEEFLKRSKDAYDEKGLDCHCYAQVVEMYEAIPGYEIPVVIEAEEEFLEEVFSDLEASGFIQPLDQKKAN
jgi:hypothetical protein